MRHLPNLLIDLLYVIYAIFVSQNWLNIRSVQGLSTSPPPPPPKKELKMTIIVLSVQPFDHNEKQ